MRELFNLLLYLVNTKYLVPVSSFWLALAVKNLNALWFHLFAFAVENLKLSLYQL
jgi:hypothetical protein